MKLKLCFFHVALLHYSPIQIGYFYLRKLHQAAILRFHGCEWRGCALKVESVRDDPRGVRVPESLVEYVSGRSRRVKQKSNIPDNVSSNNPLSRISRDDVDRLSRGQPSKRKGYGSRNVPHRLNEPELAELDRAANKGYLTVMGTGNRRPRKGSPLLNSHRQWCDARAKPQIVLYKAVGGRAVDQVVVDLSPLRLHGLFDSDDAVEEFLIQWKTDILREAYNADMELREGSNFEDDEECISNYENSGAEAETSVQNGVEMCDNNSNSYTITILENVKKTWATQPIWKLPVMTMGVFEGERSKAKTMAAALAKAWEIPEPEAPPSQGGAKTRRTAGANKGGRTKLNGLTERRRGGGHRQAF